MNTFLVTPSMCCVFICTNSRHTLKTGESHAMTTPSICCVFICTNPNQTSILGSFFSCVAVDLALRLGPDLACQSSAYSWQRCGCLDCIGHILGQSSVLFCQLIPFTALAVQSHIFPCDDSAWPLPTGIAKSGPTLSNQHWSYLEMMMIEGTLSVCPECRSWFAITSHHLFHFRFTTSVATRHCRC